MERKKKVRVLVVDDSALVRRILSDLLNQDPGIEVVGTASDGAFVLRKVRDLQPDVVTLDVEMRQKGGLEILPELMATYPLPVIMVSSLTERGAAATSKALEKGAVDFITKPSAGVAEGMQEIASSLAERIKAVVGAKVRKKTRVPLKPAPRVTPPPLPPAKIGFGAAGTVIGMGASTGGTEALKDVLVVLPREFPPVVIVQHMPEGFTRAFADRIDGLARLKIKEAENNEMLEPGKALIAPGHSHLTVKRRGRKGLLPSRDTACTY